MDELIGRQIDNYRIDALLGEGGMGSVYRAYDLNLARPVALKVMHNQLARNKEFQMRFIQEARAAAGLNEHPSIVPIYYFGEKQGLLFMVMALVSGGSLSAHIQRLQKTGEVVQLNEILALLAQVADALGYAHRKGVVHRDIKPGNVLLQRLETPDREGDPSLRAVVTDFGLAKLKEGGLETRTGEVMGTYGYMSPEQCLQKELDGRSDIYSLGVMLYQLTTGRLPFDIQSPTDAVMKHLNEIPPSPRSVWPSLPVKVETIIQTAIAKKPEERYQKAEMMAQALREAAKGLTDVDVTEFIGQRTTLSIVTHMQSVAMDQQPSRIGDDLTPMSSEDQLLMAQKDHTPRAIPLNKPQLTIGRSNENDIVLDHPDVSRQHARLERSSKGWQITDLKSTNGTFVDGAPLLAGIAEVFPLGKTLRIGPYFFHWRQSASQALPVPVQTLPPTTTHTQSSSGMIGVTAQPNSVETLPGNRVAVQVELFNQGMVVDHFKLHLADLPPSWVSIPQPVAELMPGKGATLSINILPPQDSSAKAGDYGFRIIIESQTVPSDIVTITAQLKVKPFEGFSVDLHPTRLSSGENSRLTIRNEGNEQAIFSLTGRDPGNEVIFSGEQARIRVTAGETVVRQIAVKARKRPILGSTRILPFEVQVKPTSGTYKGIAGQMIVKPVIPFWVLPLLGVVLAVCLVAGGFGVNLYMQNNIKATQTAEVATGVAVAGENVLHNNQTQASQETATAAFAAAQTAAVESTLALTAVAQGDDDGDGLSNQKELSLGTDPKVADTDQDGLIDGQEINQFGTNPLKKDTDGDNLTDGDEVNKYHTNPTNPDTDGDGVQDGVEVSLGTDPGLPPTATSTPSDTPSPTATSTPSPSWTWTPTSTKPLIPTTLVPLPLVTWNHNVGLVGSRNIFHLRLTGSGTIHVRATWAGTQTSLALIINGPGKTNAYARVDGSSPLEVSYDVTSSDFSAGNHWTVSIVSFGDGRADGTVDLTYPGGSSISPYSCTFTIVKDSVSSISLIVLDRAGTINAQASWTAASTSLALIINGPGQVGAFVRKDGSSPLSVSYRLTSGNYAAGDTWRVSLVSFSSINTEAQITLNYP